MYKVELDKKRQWFWRIVAINGGKTVLTSETYATKWNAKRMAQKMAAINNFEYKECA